jgi:hypothetical protein
MLNPPLTKQAYQRDPNVIGFTNWLSANLRTPALSHSYFHSGSKTEIRFKSVHDAWNQYAWNHSGVTVPRWAVGKVSIVTAGQTLASNTQALAALADLLRLARNDHEMVDACLEVFRWGGVLTRNAAWLHANKVGLHHRIRHVNSVLRSSALHGPATRWPANLRFNSAMTKVHSLMVSDLIIYDSRVAAGLGLAVRRWLNVQAISSPASHSLSFPWAPGRSRLNGTQPLRNAELLRVPPGTAALVLKRFPANAVRHVWANLYASWLLELVLPAWPGATLRDLEAALFMIGYDIKHAPPTSPGSRAAVLPINRKPGDSARSAYQA